MRQTYKKPYDKNLVVGAAIRDGAGNNIVNQFANKADKDEILKNVIITGDPYIATSTISAANNEISYGVELQTMSTATDEKEKVATTKVIKEVLTKIEDAKATIDETISFVVTDNTEYDE